MNKFCINKSFITLVSVSVLLILLAVGGYLVNRNKRVFTNKAQEPIITPISTQQNPSPKLLISDLPPWVQEIWKLTPQLSLNEITGRVSVTGIPCASIQDKDKCENQLLLLQTYINKVDLKPLTDGRYPFISTKLPSGLVLHWFGNIPEWENKYAKNKWASEYVTNGLGSATSVAFLVGDQAYSPSNGLDSKVSIVQAELPSSSGLWPHTAHAIYKNIRTKIENPGDEINMYLVLENELTNKYKLPQMIYKADEYYKYRNAGPFQTLTVEVNSDGMAINKNLLGIEVLGYNFYKEGFYPSIQTRANVLGLMIMLGKKYGWSGLSILGHYQVDLERGDPGAEFMYEMKILYGLAPLLLQDQQFAHSVYKPFLNADVANKSIQYSYSQYFRFMEEQFKKSRKGADRKTAVVQKRLRIDDIINTVVGSIK